MTCDNVIVHFLRMNYLLPAVGRYNSLLASLGFPSLNMASFCGLLSLTTTQVFLSQLAATLHVKKVFKKGTEFFHFSCTCSQPKICYILKKKALSNISYKVPQVTEQK